MGRKIFCVKLQQEADGLDAPPYPGQLGQKIFETISAQIWQQWLTHQTMLINEYRLNLIDQKSREFLRQEMEKFLFGQGSTKPVGYNDPKQK
ncbi:MAG: oxidative damage protection protein [Coxiella sp. RIFCSPHIGHO2_12_FULL_42_15]|nr:MAG: oxidative damage protection protein [Coxiella sp. RIFCSPHIGHO2_12_FULL_42_15]